MCRAGQGIEMNGRAPPRNLPTLTEVVRAEVASAVNQLAAPEPVPEPAPAPDATPVQAYASAPEVVDRDVLARQIFWQVRPQLEAELRNVAMALFEAQFSALLPSLHLQIEEAVREAIDQALPHTDSYR